MVQKELEQLMGKLRSIHIAVPVAVAHLYHIQSALFLGVGGVDRAWLSPEFHQEIAVCTTSAHQSAIS